MEPEAEACGGGLESSALGELASRGSGHPSGVLGRLALATLANERLAGAAMAVLGRDVDMDVLLELAARIPAHPTGAVVLVTKAESARANGYYQLRDERVHQPFDEMHPAARAAAFQAGEILTHNDLKSRNIFTAKYVKINDPTTVIGHSRTKHMKKGAVAYGAVSASEDWLETLTWHILSGGEVLYECYVERSAEDGAGDGEGGDGAAHSSRQLLPPSCLGKQDWKKNILEKNRPTTLMARWRGHESLPVLSWCLDAPAKLGALRLYAHRTF